MKRKKRNLRWVSGILAIVLMFFTAIIPPFSGLTGAGMQVLGIMAGAVILWLTNGIGWTNFLVLLAMMTVPGIGATAVISGSFGNETAVFVLLCFMLSISLKKTGLAKRIAYWFVTNRLGRKSPWWTIAMYDAALFLVSLVLSSVSAIVIFLPCMTEMLEQVGNKKEEKNAVSSMMVLGTAIIAQLADSCTPLSPISIAGMSLYSNYAEGTIEFFNYFAALAPVAVAGCAAWFLYARYIWKPDVSSFEKLDYDALNELIGPMSNREKTAAGVYITVIILWVLPGIVRYFLPELYPTISVLNKCIPPIAALILLNMITVDGAPVLSFSDAFQGADWRTYIFIGTVMELGALVSNAEIGLSSWFGSVLSPVFGRIHPIAFLILICLFSILLTNFVSNAVGLAVNYAIALPLCQSVYSGLIPPMAMGLLITATCQYAWSLPSSAPSAVVAAGSGWINTSTMYRRGMAVAALTSVVVCLVGIPFVIMLAC